MCSSIYIHLTFSPLDYNPHPRLLLATRQTAALRKDETTEVTVINLLLRSYLAHNQYDQADRLIAKTNFQGQVNQAQSVRWLFYAGRLRAIQLNYSKAKDYFQTAIRRAPKDEVAPGFVQAVSARGRDPE
jgi:26S proteasome regulatory subunit N3